VVVPVGIAGVPLSDVMSTCCCLSFLERDVCHITRASDSAVASTTSNASARLAAQSAKKGGTDVRASRQPYGHRGLHWSRPDPSCTRSNAVRRRVSEIVDDVLCRGGTARRRRCSQRRPLRQISTGIGAEGGFEFSVKPTIEVYSENEQTDHKSLTVHAKPRSGAPSGITEFSVGAFYGPKVVYRYQAR
jgi:hypothetical protein